MSNQQPQAKTLCNELLDFCRKEYDSKLIELEGTPSFDQRTRVGIGIQLELVAAMNNQIELPTTTDSNLKLWVLDCLVMATGAPINTLKIVVPLYLNVLQILVPHLSADQKVKAQKVLDLLKQIPSIA